MALSDCSVENHCVVLKLTSLYLFCFFLAIVYAGSLFFFLNRNLILQVTIPVGWNSVFFDDPKYDDDDNNKNCKNNDEHNNSHGIHRLRKLKQMILEKDTSHENRVSNLWSHVGTRTNRYDYSVKQRAIMASYFSFLHPSQNSKKSHKISKKVTSNLTPLFLKTEMASGEKLDGFELQNNSGSF
jgi:hypothetical protein